MPGRLRSLEFEAVRHSALQENFATKKDLSDVKEKIADLGEKLTEKITSSNRFVMGSFIGLIAIFLAIAVLIFNWLWDVRGKLPDIPVAPAVHAYTPGEPPYALPSQADPAVTRVPDRPPPALVADTVPAPCAPESGQAERESSKG
ncbi:MAG: hypothetical protein LBT40_09645 [Deltaproteobacteria bacterium]|jgi:hypothetical protein|nr:hypothetical protein [Deltaproteobacteria bacterium]